MIPLHQLTIASQRIPQSKSLIFAKTWWNNSWVNIDYYIIALCWRMHKFNTHLFSSTGSSRRKQAEVRWSDPNGGRRCSRWWRATNWSHANLSGSACKVASRTLFKSQSVASSQRSTGLALFTRGPFVFVLDIFCWPLKTSVLLDRSMAWPHDGGHSCARREDQRGIGQAAAARRSARHEGRWRINPWAFTDHASREKMNSFLFKYRFWYLFKWF